MSVHGRRGVTAFAAGVQHALRSASRNQIAIAVRTQDGAVVHGIPVRLGSKTAIGLAALLATAATALPAQAAAKARPTVTLVRADASGVEPGQFKTVDANCPSGYDVLGGSFFIGGESVFAHADDAIPFNHRSYRVTLTSPLVNPFSGVPRRSASVKVGAICAEIGRPVVVDGPFGAPKAHKPGKAAGTVSTVRAGADGIENNTITTTDAKCPGGTSVFAGGYVAGGSLWAHTATVSVLSRLNAFRVDFVHPPFNPTLGVLRQHAAIRVLGLCAKNSKPVVFNFAGAAARSAAAPKKPKKKPKTTVVLVKKAAVGIKAGSVRSVDAKCPSGYSVFGGSETIGDSTLAHATAAGVLSKSNEYEATVTNPPVNINAGIPKSEATLVVGALCAKRGVPIVVNGAFPQR